MRVAVTLEARFQRSPDGAVWTTLPLAYGFWKRYLDAFEEVLVIARMIDVDAPPAGARRADGANIRFFGIPDFSGAMDFARSYRRLRKVVRSAVQAEDAVIMRVPSVVGTLLESAFRGRRPYGVEVVGDPADALSPGAVSHPLRPLMQRWFVNHLRAQCAGAAAAAYVTAHTLQERYPQGRPGKGYSYSSIDLVAADYQAPRTFSYSDVELTGTYRAPGRMERSGRGLTVITVGSLARGHKGTDVLIEAIAICHQQGLPVTLLVAGDGALRSSCYVLAASLGIAQHVEFLGQLPAGPAVQAALDRADLFALPSRHEGLPRAMLEAMARGLPCIGSTAGGIPELLESEEMVPPGNATALAGLLEDVLRDPRRMLEMAQRNYVTALGYREDALRVRRREFYGVVRNDTEAWIAARPLAADV